jgi:hypothetical protein
LEFKLHDWRRAIAQAQDHLLGVDHAYVCMPKRSVTESMLTELKRAGVGLMYFQEDGDWPFEIVVEAPASVETWGSARARVCTYLSRSEVELE